jgi:hypothetical protein
MGIGIVSILVPAMALVLPDQFAAINPFDSDEGVRRGATAMAATAPMNFADRIAEEETVFDPTETGSQPRLGDKKASISESETTEATHDHEAQPNEGDSPPESSSSTDTSKPASTSSTAPKTVTTKSNSEDDSPDKVKSDGTITGDSCPCKVTGTVELKGDVNLQGDLMVMGGTLVARPGVTVNGNGFQIMFMEGGKADFQGSKTSTWSGNGSNANLSRDVEFRNLRRIMFHETGPSILKYIAVIDSGTKGVTDDYPLHWHHSGSTSRGTVVEGVVVQNGRNHAYVPHASHGITFKDVIAKNTVEEAFWWNTPRMDPCSESDPCTANDSHDIRIDHALADGISGSSTRVAAFLLGQGKGNVLVNSLTRNVGGSQQCSGYKWATDMHSNWFFSNNRAVDPNGTCGNGIFVWQNLRSEDPQPLIQDFTSDLAIEHGAYRNFYTYDNIDVSLFISHARSYTVKNSTIDEVRIVKNQLGGGVTEFSNVTIGKVVMLDAADEPSKIVFDKTNITCDDVNLEKAHPQSEVIVNGTECNG